MRKLTIVSLSILCLAAVADGAADKTPAAVKKAVEGLFGKNQQVTISKEDEDGKTVYEAAVATKLEVVLTDKGQIVETEVALPVGALPTAVAAGVKAKLAKGDVIVEAEVVVAPGGTTYEVEAKLANGDEMEYVVDVDGKVREEKHEGADDDEDDDDKD